MERSRGGGVVRKGKEKREERERRKSATDSHETRMQG